MIKKDLLNTMLSQKLTKEQIDPFFSEWEKQAHRISLLHKHRETNVKESMEAGIVLYQNLLAHCSDRSQEKPLVPINGEERLAFIMSCIGSYAAFRQLDELFSEMKKMIASRRVQLKKREE